MGYLYWLPNRHLRCVFWGCGHVFCLFQDYVDKAIAGEAGVPINYYLKPITKLMIAQM